MKGKFLLIGGVGIFSVILLASSCSPGEKEERVERSQDYYQTPAPQPPQIIQAPQDSGLSNILLGGLLGHTLAGRSNQTIIHRVERPNYRPSFTPTLPKPSTPTLPPTIKPKVESKGLQSFRSGKWR